MKPKHILQFIVYDPLRKIIAIIFAFGLWFFVSLDGVYQQTKKVHILYDNVGDSLIIIDSLTYIETFLQGRGSVLFSTWAAPPKARCDLKNLKPGAYEIPVESLDIVMPFNNISIEPTIDSIPVVIDSIITKQVNVTVPTKGVLKDHYSIRDIVVDDTITVVGPSSMLQSMKTVLTETLDIKNRNATFSKTVDLSQISPLIQLSQPRVAVEVFVDTTIKRTFTNIPLKLIFTPYQKVTSERISLDTLIIKGPRSRMETLNKGDITVRITLTQLTSGEYDLPATIILPDYVMPVYSTPQKFPIKIY